jgi:malate synthase
VPVVAEAFAAHLRTGPHQKARLREDVRIGQAELLDVRVPGGRITEAGVTGNISVAIQYLAGWLGGAGAVAINNLMEDTATAEIARAQLWQWIRHGVRTDTGRQITLEYVRATAAEVLAKLQPENPSGRLREAAELLDQLISAPELPEFLTMIGYGYLA